MRSTFGLMLFLALAPLAQAQLHFPQTTVDWGDLKRGANLVQRFPFVNQTQRTVEVLSVKSSCGCLTPRCPARIAPGESGVVELEVNTLSQPAGPNAWRATLDLGRDDGTRAEMVLTVRAKLIAELAIEPASLNLIIDRPTTQVITLTDYRPEALQVTGVQGSKPGLKARKLPPRHDEQGRVVHAVEVQLTPDFPDGRHEEVISVYTSDPEYRELRIPVSVTKKARQRITAVPDKVAIPVQAGQGKPSKIVLIRDADDQPIEIEKAICEHTAVQCRWAKSTGGSLTLRVEIDATQVGSQSFKTEIQLHLTHPVPQVLKVPVECEVTPGL